MIRTSAPEPCRYSGQATIYTSICQTHHRPKLICELDFLRAELSALRKHAKKTERMYGVAEMGRRHAEEERRRFLDERNALNEKLSATRHALALAADWSKCIRVLGETP